jgi:hypothetical protein
MYVGKADAYLSVAWQTYQEYQKNCDIGPVSMFKKITVVI